MKLIKLQLQHFRQFYGKHEITFAVHDRRNVTLIHAENGVGKTTLLNAILWAFYGFVTKKFEQKEKILNFEAKAEGLNVAMVEVSFEHKGQLYLARRRHREERSEQEFKVYQIGFRGVQKEVPAETFINSVIPKDMARYFFFDGEHAESFSSETDFKSVGKAIRDMLGCSLAEKAIEDLDYAAKELNRQIGGLPGQLELKTLESQLSKLQLGKEDAATLLEKLQDQKTAVEGEIETTLAQLREAASAREIQRRRDDKVKQLADISERLSSAEQSVVRWLGNKSLAVVAQRLTKQSLNFIDEASLKGRIPSPYNEDFVQELLDSKTCVCKRPLAEGSRFWVECGRARYSL